MYKLIVIANWVVVGVLALLVGAETLFPAKGGDAAGRGMGLAIYYLAIIALVILVILNLVPYRWAKYTAFGLVAGPIFLITVGGPIRRTIRGIVGEVTAEPPFPDRERNRVNEAIWDARPDQVAKHLADIAPDSLRNPDYTHELLRSAMQSAANGRISEERYECLRVLLRAGVPVRSPAPEVIAPHIEAAGNGNTEVLKILLEFGADPNARTYNYSTGEPEVVPMIFEALGISGSAYDCVRLLLDHGADPNAVRPESGDEGPQTILYFAAARQRWDVCRLLLERGADPGPERPYGKALQILVETAERDEYDTYSTLQDLAAVRQALTNVKR